LSRRLERDLLCAGASIVRVPPKLMAHARDSARSYGKSDPIDALAVARAALRETDLPTAQLDGLSRTVRLLSDHRDHLVAERTRLINRLRWHLHELDPGHEPPVRALWRPKHLNAVKAHLERLDGQGENVVARLARELIERCRELTEQIRNLGAELDILVEQLAPTLLTICGCGHPDRGQDHRRNCRRPPVQVSSRVRAPQRHGAAAGLVQQPTSSPSQPYREPATQRGDPPDRHHASAQPRASPTTPSTPTRRWEE
jgi:hypothetical protein